VSAILDLITRYPLMPTPGCKDEPQRLGEPLRPFG
jgi:hypothetical protein